MEKGSKSVSRYLFAAINLSVNGKLVLHQVCLTLDLCGVAVRKLKATIGLNSG